MARKEKKNEELYFVIGMICFLGLIILAIDLFYSDFPGMIDTFWYSAFIGAIILHGVTILAAIVCLKEWEDPEFNIVRKWFCGLAFATFLYVGGFRAAKNERQAVVDDSNKAKQEQTK